MSRRLLYLSNSLPNRLRMWSSWVAALDRLPTSRWVVQWPTITATRRTSLGLCGLQKQLYGPTGALAGSHSTKCWLPHFTIRLTETEIPNQHLNMSSPSISISVSKRWWCQSELRIYFGDLVAEDVSRLAATWWNPAIFQPNDVKNGHFVIGKWF